MTATRPLLSAALLLSLTACFDDTSGLTEVLPDDRILINLDTQAGAQTARSELGEWSELYVVTAQVTDDVNGLIGGVLHLVDAVVQLRPSEVAEDGNRAVWGPYADSLDPVETSLVVEYHPDTDMHSWAFVQRPKNQPDAEEVVVIVGEIDPGATRQKSSGRFAIDFSAMTELDPTVHQLGGFATEYSIDRDGAAADATFQAWEDLSRDEPVVDATYSYRQDRAGEGELDLAWSGDHRRDGDIDTFLIRSRWLPTGEGRADAVLADGGDSLAGAVSECWNEQFALVWISETGGAQGGTAEEGDADLCAYASPSFRGE